MILLGNATMPLYEYELVNEDGTGGEVFEWMQRMSDAPLTMHPETGKLCRRIIAAPNAVSRYGGDKMSNANLGRMGFTKYEKAGDGYYEKKAGSGPDVIKR
jgi:predicted nucleic acid-binding Zn ribbon protein